MICFKCGAPASISMSGMVILSCSCFPVGVTKLPTRCPLCGEVVYVREYHRCGFGHVTATTTNPAPVPVASLSASQGDSENTSEITQEYAQRICDMLAVNIAEHKKICGGCQALDRSCFEILPTEETLKKWQKKTEGVL